MSIVDTLNSTKTGLEELLNYSNGVTGALDQTLSDAIRTLAEGYGGELPSGVTGIACGEHVLESAVSGTATFTVTHNLGAVPSIFIFYAPANIAQTNTTLMAIRTSWYYRSSTYVCWSVYHNASNTTTCTMANNTGSTTIKALSATTATITNPASSYTWRVGTYKWLAIKLG